MNKIVRLKPGADVAQPLNLEDAETRMAVSATRADEIERLGRSFRRNAWINTAIGAFVGLTGLGVGAYTLLREEPSPHYFSLVNPATGEVTPAVPAVDAPRMFSADTARQYLRMFVEACGGYNDTVRTQAFARCVALMAPNQQVRYREAFTSTNPNSPQNTISKTAIVVPESLRYTQRPSAGRIQYWTVDYMYATYRNGQRTATPWTATVQFEWRPDLRMTEDVRTWNPAGMRVVDYSFGPNTAQ